MRFFLTLIFFTAISYGVFADGGLSAVDSKLGNILREDNRGRFEYAFNEWITMAKEVLSETSNFNDWQPHNLKQLCLPDSSMQIFYFVKKWKPTECDIRWLVRLKFENKIQICSFQNDFAVPLVKKMAADTIFEFSSTFLESNTIRLETLTLQGSQSARPYLNFIDIRTMALFELMHERNAVADRTELLAELDRRLNMIWTNNELFSQDWSNFKRMMTLTSKNGQMRICTYIVPTEGFSSFVKGAVLIRDNNKIDVIALRDRTDEIKAPERTKVSSDKWYGTLYTDLVETNYKNSTTYTLLGFKSNDGMVKTRTIDVMIISGKKIYFGAPIFKQERKTYYRHIFQYAAGANMMLHYDDKLKKIVFDHLSPSDPIFKGQYRFYGPDFSYDGYRFEKGDWIFESELDLRNPKIK